MSDPRFSFISDLADTDEQAIRELLGGTTIQVLVASQAVRTFAGQVLVYQLATLLVRLFDRVELQGDDAISTHLNMVLLNGQFLPELRNLLRVIRPIEPVPRTSRVVTVMVGNVESGEDTAQADIFVGATDWCAAISLHSPQEVLDTTSPVGSLAAGALGASEVFKLVFAGLIQGVRSADEYSLSLLDYSVGGSLDGKSMGPIQEPGPELPEQVDIDAVLYGCGSIGCGLILGLMFAPQVRGHLVTVDKERLEEPNLYKYALLRRADITESAYKAVWAQKQMSTYAKGRVRAQAFVGTAEAYVASLLPDYTIPLAISAVDSVESRFEIQDTLPRKVINAGILGTTAEVSVHNFGEGPCLACMVIAERNETWDPKPIAERLGLTPERVVELMPGNVMLTVADIAQIKQHGSLSAASLNIVDAFVGKSLLALWVRAAYSEATVQIASGNRVQVTTAFVSALAGVMLLAELIKELVVELRPFVVGNSYRLELLGIPVSGAFMETRDETGTCLCHSSFRLMMHNEKYPRGDKPVAQRAA